MISLCDSLHHVYNQSVNVRKFPFILPCPSFSARSHICKYYILIANVCSELSLLLIIPLPDFLCSLLSFLTKIVLSFSHCSSFSNLHLSPSLPLLFRSPSFFLRPLCKVIPLLFLFSLTLPLFSFSFRSSTSLTFRDVRVTHVHTQHQRY